MVPLKKWEYTKRLRTVAGSSTAWLGTGFELEEGKSEGIARSENVCRLAFPVVE
jgi:hypothetical protein